MNYGLNQKNIINYPIVSFTTIFNHFRFQANYEKYLKANLSNVNIRLLFDLHPIQYFNNFNGSEFLNQRLTGPMRFCPQIGRFHFYSEPQIGKSAVYIEGLNDSNNNGVKDDEEYNIHGNDYVVNAFTFSEKFRDGGEIFYGLNLFQENNILINEINLEESKYIFEFSEIAFIKVGNRQKVIRLPYYKTGEIGRGGF